MPKNRDTAPRSAPHLAFAPALLWMIAVLAGADLLLAQDASPTEQQAKKTLSYFAPRTALARSEDDAAPGAFPLTNVAPLDEERTDPHVQPAGLLSFLPPATTPRVARTPSTGVMNNYLQTIRWDPTFDQRAKPTLLGNDLAAGHADANGIRQVSHDEVLPAPGDPSLMDGKDLLKEPGVPSSMPNQAFNFWCTDNIWLQFDGLIRGYYHNDQRIEWSGVEATFGAEGILRPLVYVREGDFEISAESELFLNQPYGGSLFSNPLSQPYRDNFDINTFEIFQMFVQAKYQDFYFRIGKSRTPFGRYYAPLFTNALLDAPFIRTEIIDWTETGLFWRWAPGMFCFDLGITNGEPNLDTNSSKAVMFRLGFNPLECFVLGFSGKIQDGISSEEQKRHRSYFGLDFLYSWGNFVFYGELLYDEHGFRRDFYALTADPNNLGRRSLYGRDVYNGPDPVTGVGYYVAAGYRGDRYLIDLSYGDYFPEEIGDAAHDEPIHRTVAKLQYWITSNLQSFAVGLFENDRPFVTGLNRGTWAFFTGCQFTF